MVAALDHVDGVDLHIAEMPDRCRDGLGAGAERLAFIQPLRPQPDATGLGVGQGQGFCGSAGHGRKFSGLCAGR